MKYLIALLTIISCSAFAQTNLKTVMVDTNGVVQRPTNITFTNSISFSGSNNTASNQVAMVGSSLITRDIIDVSLADNVSYGMTGLNAATTGNNGFAEVVNTFGARVQTGSSTNGFGCFATGDTFWTRSSFSGAPMPANKEISFYAHGTTISLATNTNWVSRIVFGVGNPTRTPPNVGENALTNRGWGVEFYYNGTNQVWRPFWYTTNYNIGPETIWSGSEHARGIRMTQNGNGQITFTINSGSGQRIPITNSWSTNVDFGNNNYDGRSILLEAISATNAAQSGSGTGLLIRSMYIKYIP
jgi:hypothetical protein